MPRRAGFSLIEVLAVTAIVGTLAALLMPSFSTAREKSRVVACVNNLRQLGQAATVYNDDFGRLPPLPTSGYVIWQPSATYSLYGQLLPTSVADLRRSFFCPAARDFAINDSETGIQNLGVAGLAVASSYYMRGYNANGPVRLDGKRVALVSDICFRDGGSRHHAAGANVLFADGSVQFVLVPASWDIEAADAWDDLDRRGF